MKKITVLCLSMGLFLGACKTTNTAATKAASQKAANKAEKVFKGDWELAQILSEEGNNVEISNVFGQSSVDCFEGSDWHFVSNNNTGYYTLDGADCPMGQNKISWHLEEDNGTFYFWFKRIADGQKAKNVLSGYKMKLISADESQASFSQEVPFEGGKTTLYYYFNKK